MTRRRWWAREGRAAARVRAARAPRWEWPTDPVASLEAERALQADRLAARDARYLRDRPKSFVRRPRVLDGRR